MSLEFISPLRDVIFKIYNVLSKLVAFSYSKAYIVFL